MAALPAERGSDSSEVSDDDMIVVGDTEDESDKDSERYGMFHMI